MRRKISTLGFLAIISVGSLLAVAQVNREQKVDVGGYGVFTSQAGSGEPIVVFEAGLGEDSRHGIRYCPRSRSFLVPLPTIGQVLGSQILPQVQSPSSKW